MEVGQPKSPCQDPPSQEEPSQAGCEPHTAASDRPSAPKPSRIDTEEGVSKPSNTMFSFSAVHGRRRGSVEALQIRPNTVRWSSDRSTSTAKSWASPEIVPSPLDASCFDDTLPAASAAKLHSRGDNLDGESGGLAQLMQSPQVESAADDLVIQLQLTAEQTASAHKQISQLRRTEMRRQLQRNSTALRMNIASMYSRRSRRGQSTTISRRLAAAACDESHPTILDPRAKFRYSWTIYMSLATIYFVISSPLRAAFDDLILRQGIDKTWDAVDITFECSFLCDSAPAAP